MSRMLKNLALSITYVAVLAAPALAQEVGEEITGVISEVDGRSMTVEREDGDDVTARLGARTHVVVQPRQGGHYPDASPEFLKAGMGVRFKYAEGPLDRVHVTSVPAGAWPEGASREDDGRKHEEKVRILKIGRNGEFTADNDGRRETFRVRNASQLRSFREGDLVVIDVVGDDEVVAMRDAAISGRVVRVDRRGRRVTVEVDGRERSYTIEDEGLLDEMEDGDRIRFDVEERPNGRSVIVAVH